MRYFAQIDFWDRKGSQRIGQALGIEGLDQSPHEYKCEDYEIAFDFGTSYSVCILSFHSLDQKQFIVNMMRKIQEALLLKDNEICWNYVFDHESEEDEIEW